MTKAEEVVIDAEIGVSKKRQFASVMRRMLPAAAAAALAALALLASCDLALTKNIDAKSAADAKSASSDLRDAEEVACETYVDDLTRNGLGDDSFLVWPDGKVPYVIGEGFSKANVSARMLFLGVIRVFLPF